MSPPHNTPARSRVFRAVPESLHDVRVFLRKRCEEAGIFGAPADDILLAVSEACSNAVLHSHSQVFQVIWRWRPDRAEARVRDQGRFRVAAALHSDGLGGNGIPLMTVLMDEVSVRRGTVRRPGTDVRLVKRLQAAGRWGRFLWLGSSARALRAAMAGGALVRR
jgi:anti-sigma regulatory factor (Ser/Thr protein kinase)